MRRLRAKQLSSVEARDLLRGQGVSRERIDEVIVEFEGRGYLNDQALAEYLVTAGSERKGQGRVAIGRTLAQRGVPRDVAEAALSSLADDDAERALDFARTKAPSLVRFDEDTALRRLVGQLARRGYAGRVAMEAARIAMREARRGGGRIGLGGTGGVQDARSRVRFEDADED
ncbi:MULTISPECIES: regulatory protein RecX [Bacteria]|uniref:regulatory protein RecX n=1 Tax=Bacteria TaxID=2 RepID=UPI003C7B61EB